LTGRLSVDRVHARWSAPDGGRRGEPRPEQNGRTAGSASRHRVASGIGGRTSSPFYCEGWTQPSGEIRSFATGRGYTVEKLLTDSVFQKDIEARVGDCRPIERTTLASGAPAALRECTRIDGGWRVLVLGAVAGPRGYGLETFPTNLPLLELALEVLQGRRTVVDQLGAAPASAAIRRAETMVGAPGALVGIQDVGAHAALYRLGELQNWSAHYPESEATFRRLLELVLVEPVADQLRGVTHLIEIPAGPLLSLPLGLLVTRSMPADADYGQAPWLAREMAISVLPAAASLKDLRQVAGRSRAPQPFIGFGDPVFAGAPGDARSFTALAGLCRQGDPVDAEIVRGLPRLRETAGELTAIARSLGGDAASVILGADATETRVRATDLAQYRVVAFATHGLLPGELKCKSEPALALTPPATSSATDDGLLDASEVAQLRLDADCVVRSACNTAGPGGALGGESLSGLARAFFYAGARALLVWHWAAASRATVVLTTTTFDAQAKDPALGRAEALRRAQLALAADKATSHSFYWAPFVLVGDGGAPVPP
jgi:CHAT domain-containing protein